MINGKEAKTEPNDHVNELLSFIDNSLDAYAKENISAEGADLDPTIKKDIRSEESLILLKKKVLRLKKTFESERMARESEIKALKEAFKDLSTRMSRLLFLGFSWLLFLTFLLLRN
ncbi:hypothetical protein [Pseudomonas oryzihabitans]|uniref:hypothetical protein n=1 Tax=Pseudomonas oryzihabitans TaxID=47885 RepID=UPI0028636529|nr:hypothetical protein [Pseudomonas psychrotolerans]MDR6676688.1 uncharacterized protein YhaN [Pseudomonas psychrotolerans]